MFLPGPALDHKHGAAGLWVPLTSPWQCTEHEVVLISCLDFRQNAPISCWHLTFVGVEPCPPGVQIAGLKGRVRPTSAQTLNQQTQMAQAVQTSCRRKLGFGLLHYKCIHLPCTTPPSPLRLPSTSLYLPSTSTFPTSSPPFSGVLGQLRLPQEACKGLCPRGKRGETRA